MERKAMIRTLVVDSDTATRNEILGFLARESDVTVVAECPDGPMALEKIENLRPDAVFAGTEVPNLPGLAALTSASSGKSPYLVVISPGERHAVEAFAANAVDYLLMPIDQARLKAAMRKLRRNLEADQRLDRRLDLDTLVNYLRKYSPVSSDRQDDRIPISFGGRYRFISLKAIRYVQADRDYVDIHLVTEEVLHSTNRMSEMMLKLPADRFLRIRRSVIVSMGHIREARAKKDNYEIVMDNGVTFRPGTTYKFKVRDALVKGTGETSAAMPAVDLFTAAR
jgi:two-component system LytT family response regulator